LCENAWPGHWHGCWRRDAPITEATPIFIRFAHDRRFVGTFFVLLKSWEDAGRAAVEMAAGTLRDLSYSDGHETGNAKISAFRSRVSLSFNGPWPCASQTYRTPPSHRWSERANVFRFAPKADFDLRVSRSELGDPFRTGNQATQSSSAQSGSAARSIRDRRTSPPSTPVRRLGGAEVLK
jgi:hypothetical protein